MQLLHFKSSRPTLAPFRSEEQLIQAAMSAASAAENSPKAFQLVVAATKQLGIGRNGSLPWKLPGDMAYFKHLTSKTADPNKQNAVVMGRKTWESIPPKFRPLKNRFNIVLTRQQPDENSSISANGSKSSSSESDVVKCSSLGSAMSLLTGTEYKDHLENIFVIGGGQVYKEAIEAPECAVIHLTVIESDFECDTFLPEIDPKRFALWSAAAPQSDNDVRYHFLCYTARSNEDPPQLPAGIASKHEEQQVLVVVAGFPHASVLHSEVDQTKCVCGCSTWIWLLTLSRQVQREATELAQAPCRSLGVR